MYLLQQFNRGKLLAVAFSIVISSTVSAGPGNYNQQGPKLIGSGAAGPDTQGAYLSLSADGNTALVAGGVRGFGDGSVFVFTRNSGIWAQQGPKLLGTGSAAFFPIPFPGAVALSGDGNTAAWTTFIAGNPSGQAVWVFTRSGGVWTEQASGLVGTGAIGNSSAGGGVALSADGNTLAFGLAGDNHDTGAVWVFKRSGGVWTQEGNKLLGPQVPNESLGGMVNLSNDGNTLAAASFGSRQAFVFTRSGGVWTPQGAALVVPTSGPFLGMSLSGDGNSILLDGYFFHRHGGIWTLGSQLPGSADLNCVLSGDGSTAVGTNAYQNGPNQVELFVQTGGGWSLHAEYSVSGAVGVPQPFVLALSANGNTMLVGGPNDNNQIGATWVFASPQLSTSLHHVGNFHHGETGATYTITVKNVGDRDIHAAGESAVNIIDKLPAGLIATDIAGDGWSCTLATASCTRQDGLAVGARFPPVTVTVNVTTSAPSSVTNAATASGGGSNWGNATDVTTIVP